MLIQLGRVSSETKICVLPAVTLDSNGGWLMYKKTCGTPPNQATYLCAAPVGGIYGYGWEPVTNPAFCPENSAYTITCYVAC
jgi:hypothetical protein